MLVTPVGTVAPVISTSATSTIHILQCVSWKCAGGGDHIISNEEHAPLVGGFNPSEKY